MKEKPTPSFVWNFGGGYTLRPTLLDDSRPTGHREHPKTRKYDMNVYMNGITLITGASESGLQVEERFTTPLKALTTPKTVHTGSSNQGNDVHPDIHLPKVEIEEPTANKTPLVIPFMRIEVCKRGCYYGK